MWRYMLLSSSMLTLLNVTFIEAASRYAYTPANSQSYTFPNYPMQQQQVSMQKYYLPRDGNIFGFQNNYPYQTLNAAATAEYARNQQNNYAFVQPTEATYAQSEFSMPQNQLLQQQQQQRQRLPYWLNSEPVAADYTSRYFVPVPTTTNVHHNDYNQEALRDFDDLKQTQPNYDKLMPNTHDYTVDSFYLPSQVSLPDNQNFALGFAQNSLLPQQSSRYTGAAEYATHFERYLRKYPERLQPTFTGNGFRK